MRNSVALVVREHAIINVKLHYLSQYPIKLHSVTRFAFSILMTFNYKITVLTAYKQVSS